jgi:hypothetical protein
MTEEARLTEHITTSGTDTRGGRPGGAENVGSEYLTSGRVLVGIEVFVHRSCTAGMVVFQLQNVGSRGSAKRCIEGSSVFRQGARCK